jgi:hypothetical protein
MNTNNQPLVVAKGASTLARAKFGPGMLLQHDDLEQLTAYTRELNRLMFRSLFGCGVICGLVVSAKPDCGKVTVTVDAGLALDCQGDPIHVPQPQRLVLDEGCDQDLQGSLWVVLCGTEKCCAPRTAMCESDEDESPSVCTRERDWFEIRIVRARPRCTCACPEPVSKDAKQTMLDNQPKPGYPGQECHAGHYAGKCGCDCEDCADCDCDCVLLARLDQGKDAAGQIVWTPDHRVRRFVRPVLMRDPQVFREDEERKKPPAGSPPATASIEDHNAPEPEAEGGARAETRKPSRSKGSQ